MIRWVATSCMFYMIYWLFIQRGDARSISTTTFQTTTPPPTTRPPLTTTPPTKTPPYTTTPPQTTTSSLCNINGTYHPRNSTIAKGYDASLNKCFFAAVDENCTVVQWERFNCRSTTTPPTTTPHLCFYNGKYYPRNTFIVANGYDPINNHCYSLWLDENCDLIHGDTWNCYTTTPPTTTTTTSPTPTTTHDPNLCLYDLDGNYYPRNSVIGAHGYIAELDHCFGTYVDENCNVISWYTWSCYPITTTPQTTTPFSITTNIPTSTPSHCVYNGHTLNLNESYRTGCSGVFCSEHGLVKWDHCGCFRSNAYKKKMMKKLRKWMNLTTNNKTTRKELLNMTRKMKRKMKKLMKLVKKTITKMLKKIKGKKKMTKAKNKNPSI